MQRIGRVFAVLSLAAVTLSACGGSGGSNDKTAPTTSTVAVPTAQGVPVQPGPSPSASAPTSSATPTSTGAAPAGGSCATSQLAVGYVQGQGAAGTEYSGITFRNRSSSTCTLQGYPGVSLLDANRQQLGEPATRVPGSSPVVALAPGQSATATMTVTLGACTNGLPPKSAFLRVFPPNQRADVVVKAQVYACRPAIRPVHPGGDISPG